MDRPALTAALTDGLAAFIARARRERCTLASQPVQDASEWLAATPEVATVNAAANELGRVNGYLRRGDIETDPEFGRRLTKRALINTGLTELLRQEEEPPGTLIADLVDLLTGPSVDMYRLVVIDAGLDFAGVHDVAGWQIFQPSDADLDAMRPVPAAARFADDPWDTSLRLGGCSVLRCVDPQFTPRQFGMWLPGQLASDLADPEFTIPAWEPLLLLNLAQSDRVLSAAEYEVEPGRSVFRLRGSGVPVGMAGNEEEQWDVPEFGPCDLNEYETAQVLQATRILAPYLLAWRIPASVSKSARDRATKRWARLSRSATRFLAIGNRFGYGSDVVRPQDRSEVIFWIISALENLMVPEAEHGDLARKLKQRVAVLLSDDDDEKRLHIASVLATAYSIRSTVAHGGPVKLDELDQILGNLRAYLREVFIRLIILGRDFDVDKDCDEALLSATARRTKIQEPVNAVVSELPSIVWQTVLQRWALE